jgi:ATP-binding cassette, subfamily C (CFTR/MRP), member 1
MSLLYFHWVQPLVRKGRAHGLQVEDLPPLAGRLRSEAVAQRLQRHWDEELRLLDEEREEGGRKRQPSLWRALWRSFGMKVALGGLLKLGNDVCVFLSPLVLRQIILHLQQEAGTPSPSNLPKGIVLSICMFGVYLSQSLFFNNYFALMNVSQAMISSSLVAAIYDKSCRLSTTTLLSFSHGFVHNCMAVDAKLVGEAVLYLHTVWSGVLQISIALFLLDGLLGTASMAAGVIFVLLACPLQVVIMRLLKTAREQASGLTDKRVGVVSEALSGIGIIKYMAWERAFLGRILNARLAELTLVRRALVLQAINSAMSVSIPIVLSLVAFTTYILTGGRLDASVIFPALSLFQILRPQFVLLPGIFVSIVRSMAAVDRCYRFLMAKDLPRLRLADADFGADDYDAVATNASVAWEHGVSLRDIDMRIPAGSLTCIVGPVASGKSTLLAGFLGEAVAVGGKIGIHPGRSVAYVPQQSFIQNATLRENVLFGSAMDEERYRKVLRLSGLLPDLKTLPAGDLTEIGGKGVNLSGGQKARCGLARAVYRDADVVLLDAPLAAVDAHVGRFIWEECIVGDMANRTRIVTTNQLQLASSPSVDYIAVLQDGSVVEFGLRSQLLAQRDSAFSRLLQSQQMPAGSCDDDAESDDKEEGERMDEPGGASDGIQAMSAPESGGRFGKRGRLVQREAKSSYGVDSRHYWKYVNAAGGVWLALTVLALFLASQAASVGTNVFLSTWSEESRLDGYASRAGSDHSKLLQFMALSLLAAALPAVAGFGTVYLSLRASVVLHEQLCVTVFGSPSWWFDSTPTGRILNRFNSSLDKVDNSLAFTVQSVFRLALNLVSSFAVIFWVTPMFCLALFPTAPAYMWIQSYFRNSAIDLRRLESVTRSPLYSHFGETLDGVISLRAYKAVKRFRKENARLTDCCISASYSYAAATRWLSSRLELLAALLTFCAAGASVVAVNAGRVSPELCGLSLGYSLQMVMWLSWSVRQVTDAESQFSSIEQLAEYSDAPPHPQEEAVNNEVGGREERAAASAETYGGLVTQSFLRHVSNNQNAERETDSWPSHGEIEFRNVCMRYRPELDLVLRDVSFKVEAGWTVGICGRTGAGKTSLVSALFRLQELEAGQILVDGVDIAKLRLDELRSSFGAIAQSPTLFSGTIRSNLDMPGMYSDAAMSRALSLSGLQDTVAASAAPLTLDTLVTEGGASLSAGQRQLLCLGRVLLRGSRIIVLDEATSSVDGGTDSRMSATVASELAGRTLLIVAHRLHALMRCDRVLVLDAGVVAEFDRPATLLRVPNSRLSRLVDETGVETAKRLRALAGVD